MYTTHPTESQNPNRRSEYHMNPLRGWLLTDNADSFRQGAGAYRNARDWAKEQRNRLIQDANDKAQSMSMQTCQIEESLLLGCLSTGREQRFIDVQRSCHPVGSG
jgi:hypothetical protein